MPIQNFSPGSLLVGRNLTDGIPIPTATPLDTAAKMEAAALAGSVGQVNAVDLNTKTSRSLQWGMDLQHELKQGLMLDVGYVGTRGLHLFSSYNLNQAQPGPGSVASRRPYQPIADIASVNYLGFFGASTYHALQAKLQKTWKDGSGIMLVHTYGKSIDDAIAGSSGEANRTSGYQNINDRRSARGISTFDVANRFVLSGTYELPFGKGRQFGSGVSGGLNRVVGGWQLNSITTVQSGLAFTPTMAASNLNNAGAYQLPNRICNGALPGDQRSISRWFDTTCFVSPPAGVYGNSGLEIIRGPGLVQVDLALLKNVDVTERARLQFRAEAFNIANHANFRLPNINIGAPAGGAITNTLTGFGRQLQLVAKIVF